MPNYSFSSLSDYDFEILVRDLLQKELGFTLESFTTGKDGGIDLRASRTAKRSLIIQCKHYERSGYPSLLRAVRNEAPKVAALSPSTYMLATSAPLTPHRKSELQQLLSPYCRTPHDIVGPEDLNNLLGKYPEIEQRHFKLWLTSVPVLEKVLKARVFNESAAEIDHIRRRTSRYVENESFNRASAVLEEHRYCLIVGLPGIGKTTLAEMLLIHYVDQGFEAYRLWDNVSEAREVFDPNKPQVFYYDDFLGRTGLNHKLGKNEDDRLLRFIADVRRSKRTRFILTTREYILNQAKAVYESLAQSQFEFAKCVVNLKDYTPFIRAKILYNHLYFSDLPDKYVVQFANPNVYTRIIRHPNFNPRIIEQMTEYLNVSHEGPKGYVTSFVKNLDNPHGVWKFAFDNHLSDRARNLLLVLSSLPDVTMLSDLRDAFERFSDYRSAKYRQMRSPYDFQKALRELDGNFIKTDRSSSDIVVQFHNPSIQDFMEVHLTANLNDVAELLESAAFADQAVKLCHIVDGPQDILDLAFTSIARTFRVPTVQLIKYQGHSAWVRTHVPKDELYMTALRIRERSKAKGSSAAFALITDQLKSWFDDRHLKIQGLVDILLAIGDNLIPDEPEHGHLYTHVLEILVKLLEDESADLQDYEALVKLIKERPDYLSSDEVAVVRSAFGTFMGPEITSIMEDGDASAMESWFSDLAAVAEEFDIPLNVTLDEVMNHAEPEPDLEDNDYRYRAHASDALNRDADETEIRSMFESMGDRPSSRE